MKQFLKMFFASFLAFVIGGVALIFVFAAVIAGLSKSFSSNESETEVLDKTVLVIDLENQIHELGMKNTFASFFGDAAYDASLYDIQTALRFAQTDNLVRGVLIKSGMSPNGQATLEQLRAALQAFRKSGKFVYAYGEVIPQKSYYLASVADSIYLNPAGFPELKGLATTLTFFKGSLEKLDVEPEIFYAGRFKSATEPFRTSEMSEPNRLQIRALQQSMWQSYLDAIAEHTHADTATIQQWVRAGSVQFPSDALTRRMVDRLAYWDEVEATIRMKLGLGFKAKIEYADVSDYAATVKTKAGASENKIALLVAEGEIVDGEANQDYEIASTDMVEEIQKIRNNDRIKAVVLRVNSPGGSALASDVIWRELQLLKAKKPLIVSMGDYAASGGYYISCNADSVFALPTTITGSIGVFSMFFNVEKMLNNKLGITIDEEKNAPYADFPTPTRTLTADERNRMQAFVDNIYNTFKSKVVAGRKMEPEMIDSVAQGRVWTGKDAYRLGLVDGLGGLDRAIAAAANRAGLKDYRVAAYPAPVDKFETILKRVNKSDMNVAFIQAQFAKEFGADLNWLRSIRSLKHMSGRAQMAMPFLIAVN